MFNMLISNSNKESFCTGTHLGFFSGRGITLHKRNFHWFILLKLAVVFVQSETTRRRDLERTAEAAKKKNGGGVVVIR